MNVKTPPHILSISPNKLYMILDRTDLFHAHIVSFTHQPRLDRWGRLESGAEEAVAVWRQANPISEGDWNSHEWVTYSVVQYSGLHMGQPVQNADDLKPGWFYILMSDREKRTIAIACAPTWAQVIEKGCELLGYLPTGTYCARHEPNPPAYGRMPAGYPSQYDFYKMYRKSTGKHMSGI